MGTRPSCQIFLVIVNFPGYIGKMSYKGLEGCWPVIPRKSEWYNDRKERCSRRMLSLAEAYAMTIHSSQGQSLSDPVIICLICQREFAEGLTFTAISRVRKFNQLSFHPTLPSYKTWFKKMKQRPKFKDRLAHEKKERESDANFDVSSD